MHGTNTPRQTHRRRTSAQRADQLRRRKCDRNKEEEIDIRTVVRTVSKCESTRVSRSHGGGGLRDWLMERHDYPLSSSTGSRSRDGGCVICLEGVIVELATPVNDGLDK